MNTLRLNRFVQVLISFRCIKLYLALIFNFYIHTKTQCPNSFKELFTRCNNIWHTIPAACQQNKDAAQTEEFRL